MENQRMWEIDKQFDFCYGHRVHNQKLNSEYTSNGDQCLKCRHLHGHQGKIKVHLKSPVLEGGMVTDFKHLGWFKDFIDDTLDHKFIMDINDPIIWHEVPELCKDGKLDFNKLHRFSQGFWLPDLNQLQHVHPAVYEKYEGMVFVDFVPTSENLTSWLLDIARKKMRKIGVVVSAVEFWETPKSHCKVSF